MGSTASACPAAARHGKQRNSVGGVRLPSVVRVSPLGARRLAALSACGGPFGLRWRPTGAGADDEPCECRPPPGRGGAHDGAGYVGSRMEGVQNRGGLGLPPRESPCWPVGTGFRPQSSATGSPFCSTSVTTPPPTAPPATPTSRRPTSSSSPPAPTRPPVTPTSPAPPPTPSPSTSKFSTRQDRSCSWEWNKTQKQSKKTQPGRHGLVRITRFSGLPAKSVQNQEPHFLCVPGSEPGPTLPCDMGLVFTFSRGFGLPSGWRLRITVGD